MFDNMNDMVSYTAKYMAASIATKGLELSGKPGETAWLKKRDCTLELTNIENDCVVVEIHNVSIEGGRYFLTSYLDCCFMSEGGFRKLSPNPPKDWPAERKFVSMLENYDRLLLGGYLDAPLAGDFSWVPAYHAMLADEKRLGAERYKLERAGHPEAERILSKKVNGDRTWMDDVRRILAEQESKS